MWLYLHSHLPGVPDLPSVPLEERVHINCMPPPPPAAARRKRQRMLAPDDTEEREERRRLRHNQLAAQQRRGIEQRAQRERTRISQAELKRMRADMLEEAERDRKKRSVERYLQEERQAKLRSFVVRTDEAIEEERRQRIERESQRAKAAATRTLLRERMCEADSGLVNPARGSTRANQLVRRARYLYGRTETIHFVRRLGLLAP